MVVKGFRSEKDMISVVGFLSGASFAALSPLWYHQSYPGQSLNPQTMVKFEGQEVESGWIFQKVLSLVVHKHSYMLDYQDKFLGLKHSS